MADESNLEPLIRANLAGLRKLFASLTLRSLSMSTSVCERDYLALCAALTAVRSLPAVIRAAAAPPPTHTISYSHPPLSPPPPSPCLSPLPAHAQSYTTRSALVEIYQNVLLLER